MWVERLQLRLPLATLTANSQTVGIDFGKDLVKVCFVPKTSTSDEEDMQRQQQKDQENSQISLELVLFHRRHVRAALEYVAQYAMVDESMENAENKKLCVTGTLDKEVKQLIKDILRKEAVLVANTAAEVQGNYVMLRDGLDEDLLFPGKPEIRSYGQVKMNEHHAELFENFRRQIQSGINKANRFPCMVVNLGSMASFTRINEDGSSKVLFTSSVGSQTYNQLSKLLLNNQTFEEVGELAQSGQRIKVDTQAGEMFSTDTPEYGRMPAEMPMFSFGKFSDHEELALEVVKKQDMAHALVGFCAYTWHFEMFGVALGEKLPMIYIGGSLTQEKVLREELAYSIQCWGVSMMQESYYRTGTYAAALGTLFTHW